MTLSKPLGRVIQAAAGLRLRPWAEADAAALVEAFVSPDMASQSASPLTELPHAAEWIARATREWDEGTGHSWAVTTPDDELLGSVAITHINLRHEEGWFSYWTLPSARGRGVASAASRSAAGWAFTDRGLHRLELGHRVNNPASCAVARSAGFLPEGIERDKLRYGEQRFDVERHARLASDPWPTP